jgi:hypothetical protein
MLFGQIATIKLPKNQAFSDRSGVSQPYFPFRNVETLLDVAATLGRFRCRSESTLSVPTI